MKSKAAVILCLILIIFGVTSVGASRRAVPYFGKMIYELSDTVGIGTATPGAVDSTVKLELYSNGSSVKLLVHEDAGTYEAGLLLRRGAGDWEILNAGDLTIEDEGAELVRIDTSGNVGIGTTTPTGSSTAGTKILALGDGTVPVGGRDLIGFLYSDTVGATTEVFAMDEGGTAAQLTDDAEELYYDPNQGAYIPTARIKMNPYAGIRQRLDLWKLAKAVEDLTGEKIITIEKLPAEDCRDWDTDQQKLFDEREAERLSAQAQIAALEGEITLIDPNNVELVTKKNAEKNAIKVRQKYKKKPKPNWIKKVREAIGD